MSDYKRVICRVNIKEYNLFKGFSAGNWSMGDTVAHLSAYSWYTEPDHTAVVESVNILNNKKELGTQVLNRQITVKVSPNHYGAIKEFADAVGWKISRTLVWMAIDGFETMKDNGEDITHVLAAQTRIDTHITT